jgi:cytochrome c-type biogenesis protein
LGALQWVRRHQIWVLRIGGGMLVVLGLLLVTGAWTEIVSSLQGWVSGFEVAV